MAHMKLSKPSKKNRLKVILILIIIYVSFAYTFYYSFKSISDESNEAFIKFLLNNEAYLTNEYYNFPKIINKSFNYLLNIDFTKPVTLFNQNIISYSEVPEDDNANLEHLKEVSYYISDPNNREIKEPIVYIYNSHQLENYNNDTLAKFGITPNVLMVSYLLKEKLNEKNIPTIVLDTNLTEFLSLNNWDYASSYKASRIFILDKQNTYPSLKYFIDIHRDSVGYEVTTTTINNKKYARILFVIGLEHANYQANLDTATKINNLFEEYYPTLSRGIYKKDGPNVNGIYNQDISPKAMLIEVGGVDNNMLEVMNTINAISDILGKYINNDKE